MLANIIQELPREHFHLIYYIVIMASSIQEHSEINMMNPEALAVVLAPVCTGLEQNLKEIPSWVKRHTRTKMMNDMGLFIENNAKWTRIWTLMIEHSDTLLEKWKDSVLWTEVVSPLGRSTMPSPLNKSSCNSSSNNANKEIDRNASSSSLHPSRHSSSLSRIQSTELLLDVVPPYNKPPELPQRRPSYHSNKSSDELYKVVVMRSRNCKSLKKNNNNSTKRNSLMDTTSTSYHQYYANSPLPPLTHSNSTSTSRFPSTSSLTSSSSSSTVRSHSKIHPSLYPSTITTTSSDQSL